MTRADILYIGKGSHGAACPLNSGHHRIRNDEVLASDKLFVWECPEGTKALIEGQLIATLKPRLNVCGSNGKRLRPPLKRLIREASGAKLAEVEFARKRTAPDRIGSRSEKPVRKKQQRERFRKRRCEKRRTSATRLDGYKTP